MWLANPGLLFMLLLPPLYWTLATHRRAWLLAAGGALLLLLDGWATLLAWSGLLAWLALICGPRWPRPALAQNIGLAGLLLIFFIYQYCKAWHGLLPYFGFAFVVLKAWQLIAEQGVGAYRQRRMAPALAWLLFPPSISVGPLQRYDAFRLEAMRARWDRQAASEGLVRILYGYCKIVLLAQYLLAEKLDGMTSLSDHAWLDTYLGLLAYGMNLYWQFSGYCDIAVGFAALLGVRMPENFRAPYAADTLPDFWRRWNITVSEWCRDFVFRPVFSHTRHYLSSSLCAMMALGLWHELSPRYLAWGLFHGLGLGLVHLWTAHMPLAPLLRRYRAWRVACSLMTLQFVVLSFALTSSATLAEAFDKLAILSGWPYWKG